MTAAGLFTTKKEEVMSSFLKSLKIGAKYIRRSRFLTLSCVFSMTFSLFLSLAFVTTVVLSHFVLKGLEEKAQITVFFKPATLESSILSLQNELTSRDEIESVKYVSQEDALKIYLGQHQSDPTLLESVSSSILPASLEIKTKNLASLDVLASDLRKREDVDEVVFFKDVVDIFSKWAFILRVGGLSLVALMLAVSLLVVLLAVGVSVKIRAEEIEIRRLVGATDSQVTLPFLWQGALYGFISSLTSFLLFFLITAISYSTLKPILSFLPHTGEIGLVLVVVGTAHFFLGPTLGIFSSFLGVRKYLRL